MTSGLSRREFLETLSACGVIAVTPRVAHIRVGYAAITWGGRDEQAIDEIAGAGYKGIQLRATVLERFGQRPAELRALLAARGLTFVVLSSGNLSIEPARERDMLALHMDHAAFVRDAGGLFLQVIDERPKDRAIVPDDYRRLGTLLTELGRRTANTGVPLVYHHHMNSLGERPDEIDAVLKASDPAHVGLVFDIAHYQQGGGDPVDAIRRYADRIRVVHLKDVRAIEGSPGYQWVELGQGRVDVKGAVAALREIGFNGWAIVELDRAPDPNGSPRASALANRKYVEQLGLQL